jgi:hypothetical protein
MTMEGRYEGMKLLVVLSAVACLASVATGQTSFDLRTQAREVDFLFELVEMTRTDATNNVITLANADVRIVRMA